MIRRPHPLVALVLSAPLLTPAAARAESGIARIHDRAAALALRPVPSLSLLRRRCRTDALCAGRVIARALGPKARIARRRPPDTDAIRLVKVRPTITAVRRLADGGLYVELRRFGIQAWPELRAALGGRRAWPRLVIDLRRNGGGDIARMLRLVAVFTGARERAVRLRMMSGERWLSVPKPDRRVAAARLEVLIGPRTASSAEVFAALLRRHAGACLLGARSFGKNWLSSAVPLAQGRALLVPSAIITVPGETLAKGLAPDGPLPAELTR